MAAKEAVEKYGSFDEFILEDEPELISDPVDKVADFAAKKKGEPGVPDWLPPCGDGKYRNCYDCPNFDVEKIPPECKNGYDLSRFFTVKKEAVL